MTVDPRGSDFPGKWCRVGKLWTQGGKVVLEVSGRNRSRGFDGDVPAIPSHLAGDLWKVSGQKRFSSRENHMARVSVVEDSVE